MPAARAASSTVLLSAPCPSQPPPSAGPYPAAGAVVTMGGEGNVSAELCLLLLSVCEVLC